MTKKITTLLCILLLSGCQQLTTWSHQGTQTRNASCPVSTKEVLSCIASSQQLTKHEVRSELDSLIDSLELKRNNTNLNRLLCLALHRHSSKERIQKGKTILEKTLKKDQCKQQDLKGLLLIIQENINLHNKYLNRNWKFYLERKELKNKKETIQQKLDYEIISYQRRIQDLEKQVQKLKDIESILDQKVQP